MKKLFLPLILISTMGLQAMDRFENLKKEAAKNRLTEQMVDDALTDNNDIKENSQALSNFALELQAKAFSGDETIAELITYILEHKASLIPMTKTTVGVISKAKNFLGILKVMQYTHEYCELSPEGLTPKEKILKLQKELRELIVILGGEKAPQDNAPEQSTLESITSHLFSKKGAVVAMLLFASYWCLSRESDQKTNKGPLD